MPETPNLPTDGPLLRAPRHLFSQHTELQRRRPSRHKRPDRPSASPLLERDARRAERQRLKHAERTRVETLAAQEQTAIEAVAVAEINARQKAKNARILLVVQDVAAGKAERDRRYAARKARQA